MTFGTKTLARNIVSVGIIQVANYVFPMVSIPIVSRIIGPDKFGVINFASSFVGYFILLIGFGFDLSATRKVAADPDNVENRNKVFSEVFFAQCFLLAVSVVLFTAALFFIPQLREERQVAIFTFLMCFATTMTQNWLFQAMQELHKVAILNLVSKVLFTAAVLLVIHKKGDYIWQPLALSGSQVLIAAISFVWCVRRYGLKLHAVKFSSCLKLLKNERVIFFSFCVINLYTNTNTIILGLWTNPTHVGYYTSAQKLIVILQAVVSLPLSQALFPHIGRAFAVSYNRGIAIAQKLIPLVFVFTFLSGLFIIITAPLFIHFFYGSDFEPAVAVCRILAFVPMLIALSVVCGVHVMLNLKMDKAFFAVTSAGTVFSVLLNIVLVRQFSYIGSAITWTLTELFNLSLLFVWLRRKGINMLNWDYFKIDVYKRYVFAFRAKMPDK